jgi:ATP-dependent protease ClpP protease subunit
VKSSYPIKCRIYAAAKDTKARVDIYDDIGGGDSFWGPSGLSAQDFTTQIGTLKGDLDVHINSAGGDVFDGIAISNALSGYNGVVTTIVDGLAASIASVIAQAGRHRIMQAGSMMMIHDAFGGCYGNESEMASMARVLSKVSDNLANIYATRSKRGTADSWRASMKEETWYTAEEAVVAGLADGIGETQAVLPAGMEMSAFAKVPDRIAARLVTMSQTKSLNAAIAVHHTATVDTAWDGGKAKKGFPNDASVLTYCNAWKNSDGDATKKSSYKFPHHMTKGGPANLAACRNGLARLSGSKIPDSDKSGVESHLRAHMRDGGASDADNTFDYFISNFGDSSILSIVDSLPKLPTDETPWKPLKAIKNADRSDDPEAYFRAICAGRKAGDPRLADSWALPYKYTPGSKPNYQGVIDALAKLPYEKGLTNKDEARTFLNDLLEKMNPGSKQEDLDAKLLASLFTNGLRGA